MATDKKETWVIDPTHSSIDFKIRHLMITNVKGAFNEFEANIVTTGDDFMTAEVDLTLSAASIDTGNEDRDKHIRSGDFLDVEKHPKLLFTSESYKKVDNDGSYELWGNLTIKGITNKVKLDVEFGGVMKDPWGNEKAGFTVNGKINRKDWGLNWNAALETGGVLVSDEVKISAEIQLSRGA
jgi:polyisoprenoid-binding protein YceI